MKYRSNQLRSVFAACDDWTPKIALAVHGSEPEQFGLGGLETVEDALGRFREARNERERPFEEPLLGLYRHADYSIRKLRGYVGYGRAGLDQEMAEILADLGVAIDAEAYRTGSGGTSRASSICLRRIIGSMFIRMNSKCAH